MVIKSRDCIIRVTDHNEEGDGKHSFLPIPQTPCIKRRIKVYFLDFIFMDFSSVYDLIVMYMVMKYILRQGDSFKILLQTKKNAHKMYFVLAMINDVFDCDFSARQKSRMRPSVHFECHENFLARI